MPWSNKKVRAYIFALIALFLFIDAAVPLARMVNDYPNNNATETAMMLFLVVMNAVSAIIMGYGAFVMDEEARPEEEPEHQPIQDKSVVYEPGRFRPGGLYED